jgi:nucleotide-binding universal stress UspA family protein
VLVPLDGSELAEVVFPYAKELAGRLGTEVVLLHIASPTLRDFEPMTRAYVEHTADGIRRAAEEVQRQSLIKDPKPIHVTGEMATGYPAEEILRYADEKDFDLILVARHGRSGKVRWAIGSVADKIMRSAKEPVWLVPIPETGQMAFDQWPTRTIVAPLDGSDIAEATLPHVEALAALGSRDKVNVTLLRVCEPPAMPTYYTPELSEVPLSWGQYAQQETNRCKQSSAEYLGKLEARFKATGVNVHSQVVVGKASDEVINFVKRNPYSIVAMATHGRSGLSRLVYGSVAASILVGVTNPILMIKPIPKPTGKR